MAKRILIVDDEEMIAQTIRQILKSSGYDAYIAMRAQEAMDSLDHWKPDLVLLDVIMPDLDGFTFVKIMKKKSFWPIPVIILLEKKNLEGLFEMEGITDYLVKPVEREALVDLIKKLLQVEE